MTKKEMVEVKNISTGPISFKDFPNGYVHRQPGAVFKIEKGVCDRLLKSSHPSIEIYDPEKEEKMKVGSVVLNPSSNTGKESKLTATIFPVEGDAAHFDVVLDDGDGNPQIETGLTVNKVESLLKKMNLDSGNPKDVIKSDKPMEDAAEGTGTLTGTIHPTEDPKLFTLVLDDGDDDPEARYALTKKQVGEALKEMGLDPENKEEVITATEPYQPAAPPAS